MCNFPARQLIRYAKSVTESESPLFRPDKIIFAHAVIKGIMELGRSHEDHTGCQCWDTALIAAGLREPPPSKYVEHAPIPTVYAGVQFRSRLEARWAAFFDIAGWKREYEPLDLKGWIPDFRVRFPCPLSECDGEHVLLVEVKPHYAIHEFNGKDTPEYEWAMQGCGAGLPCSAVALFGANPAVSYWEMKHGSGNETFAVPNWVENWQFAWDDAGNKVQYKSPAKKQPTNDISGLDSQRSYRRRS